MYVTEIRTLYNTNNKLINHTTHDIEGEGEARFKIISDADTGARAPHCWSI